MTPTPTNNTYANAGGFLSPAPSTASSRAAAGLPHPRSRPLVPGSRKEDYAREYVYRRLLHVSRRYVKKHSIPDPTDQVSAYDTFDQVCKDLEDVVDVLWFSGTPTLQVPYLLNVALAITEYLPSFPPSPRPTFALLKKIDHCFSSLLRGRDVRSNEPLPGFEHGMHKGMTRTDMVRIRSLADETRSQVALKMSREADVDTSIFPEDSDVVTPQANPSAKRKAADHQDSDDEMAHSARSSLSPKRQETESPISVKTESPAMKHEYDSQSPGHVNGADKGHSTNNGQFHWAVEEDSDDEHDARPSSSDPVVGGAGEGRPQQLTPPPTSGPDQDQYTTQAGSRNDLPEEDDEDQELHMSVAKVYEKTIIQLGRTLGETLVDE